MTLLRRSALLALLLLPLAATGAEAQRVGPGIGPTPPPVRDAEGRQRTGATPDSVRPAARGPRETEPDSIAEALLRLEGFTRTRYFGDDAIYDGSTGRLRLMGDAEVARAPERLTADTIVYHERLRLVEAYGSPRVSGQQQDVEGDSMFYDLDRRRATVVGGRTVLTQQATWYARGDLTLEGSDRLYTTNGTFTSDDREEPQYHFRAGEIMVVRERILVARPVWLYFGNVPVFPLPFVVQDLARGRRSGMLTPRFSINDVVRTSSGYSRRISNLGYYWALSDYMDAEVAGEWWSGQHTGIRGALRYRWSRQFLSGNLSVQQYMPEERDGVFNLSSSNSWRPDERTNLSLSANYSSSARYARRITTDNQELMQSIRSNLSASRRFDWGQATLGGTRAQSLADDRVEMTFPSVAVSFNPITLLRAPEGVLEPAWYHNATLNLGSFSGSRAMQQVPDELYGTRTTERTVAAMSPSLRFGNLSIGTSAGFNRQTLGPQTALVDTVPALPRIDIDAANWSAGTSYQIPLIGSTNLSPAIGVSQQLRSDTAAAAATFGEMVAAPLRTSFSAGLNSDLFGFFPGVGNFVTFRHRISPRFSYQYSPQAEQTELQRRVFGRAGGRTQNQVSLSLNQTIEGRVRTPPAARDTAAAATAGDTAAAAEGAAAGTEGAFQAPPSQAAKITLLSVNTSSILYDFGRRKDGLSGFATSSVTNTLSSDYLRGMNLSMTHRLFDPTTATDPGDLGSFAPRLASLNTSFSIGSGSGIVGWLGAFLGRGEESIAPPEQAVPGQQEEQMPHEEAAGPVTRSPMADRGGPRGWNASVSYALVRPEPRSDGRPVEVSQTLNGTLSFAPTQNWAVNWRTSYSINEGSFGAHSLNLRRDLYRWQANFTFNRTQLGATSFTFMVQLIDLPDLRVDYREHNIGGVDGGF